jgi:UDP-N-acetyl-D-galactosamine dehydrogenase
VAKNEAPANSTVVESLDRVEDMDAIIVAVGHDSYRSLSLQKLKKLSRNDAVLVDIQRLYDRADAEREGFLYRTL